MSPPARGDQRLAVRIAASESAHKTSRSPVWKRSVRFVSLRRWSRCRREVPHDLLPVATATSGSLSVPRSPGAWRVQAIGGERASSWVDVPTEANSVESDPARLGGALVPDHGGRCAASGRQVLPGADRRRFGAESADRAARLRVGDRRRGPDRSHSARRGASNCRRLQRDSEGSGVSQTATRSRPRSSWAPGSPSVVDS